MVICKSKKALIFQEIINKRSFKEKLFWIHLYIKNTNLIDVSLVLSPPALESGVLAAAYVTVPI